ncbi:hypothetical protein Gpo141_00012605 [Globisporangium polare]
MTLLERTIRQSKYFLVANAFISGVAFASHQFVAHFQTPVSSINIPSPDSRATVLWFDWIASMKGKILGDKCLELTTAERTSIYLRVLWLIVLIEVVLFWISAPTDLCLTNVLPFFLAVRLGLPLSELQLHLVLAYKTYVEVAGHSGLEIKGFSFPQLPWLNELFPICLRVHDHDLHHAHPKFNFAKRFSLWDKLFGTFRAGRPLNEPSSPKL